MANKYWTCFILVLILIIPVEQTIAQKTDSMVINVGKSKLIFVVNDRKDLEELEKYDLNAILKDLKLRLAEDSTMVNDNNTIVKDTTIVVRKEPTDSRWKESDEWRKDRDYYDRNRRSRRFRTRNVINFDIGTNNYLNDGAFPEESNAQYAVRPWGSWYVAINFTYQTKLSKRAYLEWGPGISWYNFKFQDDRTLITEVDGVTTFISDPDPNNDYKKSKLTASFLNVTAVPMFQFGKPRTRRSISRWSDWDDFAFNRGEGGFRIGLGGYAGYRLGSRSKVKFDGGKKDKNRDNFNLNSLRYGVRLQMGFRGTDLFFNYDLNELFTEGNGPKLNAFSFGIIL